MTLYDWVKALHIISVIAWMAAIFYLPRLFVYHADAAAGSEMAATFEVMERRLLGAIATPAMIASLVFGGWLFFMLELWSEAWMWAKLMLVAGMVAFHFACARWRRDFAAGSNRHPAKFYRRVNEIPTVLMIGIVLLVVLKPF